MDVLCRLCASSAAIAIVLMAALILMEIMLRNIFDHSLLVVDELVGYLLSASIFLALGPTFHRGAMIRMTMLTDRINGRASAVLEAFILSPALALTLFWIKHIFRAAWRFYDRGMVSNGAWPVPLWIPEAVSLIGLMILALVVAFHFVTNIRTAAGRA